MVQPGESGQQLANAQEFSDYLRLLCFSGARKTGQTVVDNSPCLLRLDKAG